MLWRERIYILSFLLISLYGYIILEKKNFPNKNYFFLFWLRIFSKYYILSVEPIMSSITNPTFWYSPHFLFQCVITLTISKITPPVLYHSNIQDLNSGYLCSQIQYLLFSYSACEIYHLCIFVQNVSTIWTTLKIIPTIIPLIFFRL